MTGLSKIVKQMMYTKFFTTRIYATKNKIHKGKAINSSQISFYFTRMKSRS